MLLRFLSWKRRKQIFLLSTGAAVLLPSRLFWYPLAKGILSSFYLNSP